MQSCVQALNRYHRGTSEGEEMGMVLSIKLSTNAVSVLEAPVRPAGKGRPRLEEKPASS